MAKEFSFKRLAKGRFCVETYDLMPCVEIRMKVGVAKNDLSGRICNIGMGLIGFR
ncbi:Hypothetical predicted protein, partial [Olea europaea subsp. europaea]